MQGTVDGFSYGLVTPVAAFLMACLGGALGLRCTTRSLRHRDSFKAGWLALGATSIGTGIWTMHFIAMMGFSVQQAPVGYDRPLTFASLGVAVLMVGVGIFIVGYRGATALTLVTGGTITGLGVATMHYLGMAGMRFQGRIEYDPLTVAASVVIAVVAATAALWAAASVHGFLASLGASLVMGGAVSGMHYTAMAAVSVHLHGAGARPGTGDTATALLLPMLIGPAVFLILAAVVVMFDPLLVMGDPDWQRPAARLPHRPGVPAPRHVPSYGEPANWTSRPARHPARRPGRRAAGRSVARAVHRSQDW
ncbi:MHYT domain-containing protein [Streptomyces sp. NPDC091368]|uniref:MHYT domain-containing protein n=1 Tax=Streptomyces sp. NPDC091368 TaxID=3365993 RepID=UPI0037F7173B